MNETSKTTLRLPLQLGISSIWSFARFCSTLVPGIILTISAFQYESIHTLLGFLGVYFVIYSLLQLFDGWQTRPSDVILTDTGFSISGGPNHGLAYNWSDLDPTQTKLEEGTRTRLTILYLWEDILKIVASMIFGKVGASFDIYFSFVQQIPIRSFLVTTHDAQQFIIAKAEVPEEQRALTMLHGSFQNHLGHAPPPDSIDGEADVFFCSNCGSALLPIESSILTCHVCNTENTVPIALQERLKVQNNITKERRERNLLVKELIDQPGAQKSVQILTMLCMASAAIWTLIVFSLSQASFASMGSFELFWGLFAGSCFVLSFFTWTRKALVKRRALNVLIADFGARAPHQEGSPPCCRSCGGPLPETESILVNCIFCDTENLLNIDMRPYQKPLEKQRHDLHEVLTERERAEGVWKQLSFSVITAAFIGGFMVLIQYEVEKEFAAMLKGCEAGDIELCVRVGSDYDVGISVGENDKKALFYYLKACSQDHAKACYYASLLYWGSETEIQDVHLGIQYGVKACQLGHSEACE